ncbi:MAG: hypothetical protein AB8H80_19220 [Planctomycetota bacterium]
MLRTCAGSPFAIASAPLLALALAAPKLSAQCAPVWSALTSGADARVLALASSPFGGPTGGGTFVGGEFSAVGGSSVSYVAQWLAGAWQPLGAGTDDAVRALAVAPNGELVAAGAFTQAGGVAANRVARWDGANWSPLGLGVGGTAWAVAVRSNGNVLVAGAFGGAGTALANNIAEWDGTSWQALGAGVNGTVRTVWIAPNDDVYVGGGFTMAGNAPASRVARWDGASWSELAGGADGPVYDLASDANGALLVVGNFTAVAGGSVSSPGIARYDGAWQALGSGVSNGAGPQAFVEAVHVLPDGDVLVGGQFAQAGVGSAFGIARYRDGAGWSAVDTGVDGPVYAISRDRNSQQVWAGGQFQTAGSVLVGNVAQLASPCPASRSALGMGCGGRQLDVVADAWIGGTFASALAGVQPNELAVAVTGLAVGATNLQSLLPQAQASCSLFVSPDVVTGMTAIGGGTVESTFALPNDPALVGAVFHQQAVVLSLGGVPVGLSNVTSSNAWSMTVGSF